MEGCVLLTPYGDAFLLRCSKPVGLSFSQHKLNGVCKKKNNRAAGLGGNPAGLGCGH